MSRSRGGERDGRKRLSILLSRGGPNLTPSRTPPCIDYNRWPSAPWGSWSVYEQVWQLGVAVPLKQPRHVRARSARPLYEPKLSKRLGRSYDGPMLPLVRATATALAALAIMLSNKPSSAACRHFSIWNFPFPQPCPSKPIGQFISEDPRSPTPTSSPTPPPAEQDQQLQRQQAIDRLKKQLSSQKPGQSN